jgi:hypothetical protein
MNFKAQTVETGWLVVSHSSVRAFNNGRDGLPVGLYNRLWNGSFYESIKQFARRVIVSHARWLRAWGKIIRVLKARLRRVRYQVRYVSIMQKCDSRISTDIARKIAAYV